MENQTKSSFSTYRDSEEQKRLENASSPKKPKSNLNLNVTGQSFHTEPKKTSQDKYLIFVTINNTMETVSLNVKQTATVQDAIESTLDILNEYRLKMLVSTDFEMFMVKKNGQPKMDYPAFHIDQQLSKTGATSFALVSNNKNQVQINILSKKSLSDIKSESESPTTKSQGNIPIRNGKRQNSYTNTLSSPQSLQEIQVPPKKKKASNWFFSILNCGQNEYIE